MTRLALEHPICPHLLAKFALFVNFKRLQYFIDVSCEESMQ